MDGSPRRSSTKRAASALAVDVLLQADEFKLRGKGADGKPVALRPSTFSIVQGMTSTHSLLSRTIGVAMADDGAEHLDFERGAPWRLLQLPPRDGGGDGEGRA